MGFFTAAHLFVGPRSGIAFGGVHSPTTSELNQSTSSFVLFEGPWLFDQPTAKTLRAITFGRLQADPSVETYRCEVGLGAAASGVLINPFDPTDDPLLLPIGGSWRVRIPPYSPAPDLLTAFSVPFKSDPFVWVRNHSPKISPRAGDRFVEVPMPTAIYVGGRLSGATVIDTSGLLASSEVSAKPYVATIFEYAQQSGATGPSLTTQSDTGSIRLPAMSHLVFRMGNTVTINSKEDLTRTNSVKSSFDELASRITTADQSQPVKLNMLKDCSCDLGTNTKGFDKAEMGIDPDKPAETPGANERTAVGARRIALQSCSNYAGGGIIVGV